MPKVQVQRSIKINAPAEVVYPALTDFHKWVEWSPWLLMEPEAKVTFSDDGKSYEWDGDRLGSGNMHWVTERENEFLDFDLNFLKPWKSANKTNFKLNSIDSGTEVIWTMDSSLPFYLFWMKNMMKAFIGSDYERGLDMLKAYVEEGEINSKLVFEGQSNFDSCKWVGIETSCSMDEMDSKMESDFNIIGAFADSNKEKISGPPFSIYKKWDLVKRKVDYIACIPVGDIPDDLSQEFTTGDIPETRVEKIKHIGAYKHLGNAWSTAYAMMRNKEFKHNKKVYPFEVYQNDPKVTPEKELITEVHFPVKS
ncbi:SRPBCC family protein [Ekhidna sp.]